jgi:hypothetical protein
VDACTAAKEADEVIPDVFRGGADEGTDRRI